MEIGVALQFLKRDIHHIHYTTPNKHITWK